ncbi:MAG: carboxypeptidase-like regulatory domain-containing protein [Melioribacteraceae bacterium]|nr:carboxypeptidase-like regulatory domain-containing protein [Melioribacteraceae bacterium]
MKLIKIAVLFVVLFTTSNAQTYTLKGNISDKKTTRFLSFANLRLNNSNIGTAANVNGDFELKLEKGRHEIIVSFIGYKSDTLNINLSNNIEIDVQLSPVSLKLDEVTILPGINPAIAIIKKAILAKKEREKKLKSYIFEGYTKGIIKSTQDITLGDNSVSLPIERDTAELKITGILENESRGFYKAPDDYKEEIVAQKQSSNFPSSINLLTGGRIIQNFYTNDIEFFGRPLPGPISDESLNYYYFYIEDTVAFDNKNVFQIYFAPDDESDPGFYGKIFIADSSFNLVKLDIQLNAAANPGGIFDRVNIFQQFQIYDKIAMPIDYRLFVEGNILGLIRFGFEINSILYEYKINEHINDDFFDMSVLKVMPNADKKDSGYWKNRQTIPNTLDEVLAYKRIDSLEAIEKTFWDRFSFMSESLNIEDNISVTGPLGLYSFTPVEGNGINLGAGFRNLFEKRLYTNIDLGYGFGDKKFKTDFYANFRLGEYRTHSVTLKVYNKVTDLFGESVKYSKFTSTMLALFTKYDFRDYYYTKGFEVNFSSEIFPILKVNLGFMNKTDKSTSNNTDFSFFKRDKNFSRNEQVFDTKIHALKAGFDLDFRKYIEDGYFRRRVSQGKSYGILSGEVLYSNSDLLKSNLDFTKYTLSFYGQLNSFKSANFNYRIKSIYSEGSIPFQMLYSLPGNIDGVSKNYSFRTLKLGEVFGDQIFEFNLEHNFNDELFRMAGLTFLTDWNFTLNTHFNAAVTKISSSSKNILPVEYIEYSKPFAEAGFSIGQVLFPFRLEFTWKLNHRGKNNFIIGINTPMF